MSVAREVIVSLKKIGDHCVDKTGKVLKLNRRATGADWAQWQMRRLEDGIVTYYEVYNPHDEVLWIEFHVRDRNFALELKNGMRIFTGTHTWGQFMYGTDVDVGGLPVNDAVRKVRSKLDDVYKTVEPQLKKSGAQIIGTSEFTARKPKTDCPFVPNTLSFEPFVGESYCCDKKTVFDKRILIVGASHYCYLYDRAVGCTPACKYYGKKHDVGNDRLCDFGQRCEALTLAVITAYRSNDVSRDENGTAHSGWKRTFTKFTNAFIAHRTSGSRTSMNSEVFAHLVDVEYVQGAEGRSHDDTNATLMGDGRNFTELENVIDKMKSEVVVLWGPRVVRQVYRKIGETDYAQSVVKTRIKNREVVFVACLPHPSSNEWEPKRLRHVLKSVGVKPLEES